jgi:integrase
MLACLGGLGGIGDSLAGPNYGPITVRGWTDASFHTLRHTAASWMVQQGVDLYAVGQILGHKTPRMTQRYAHLSPEYMAGAVGKLDRIMGGMLAQSVTPSDSQSI